MLTGWKEITRYTKRCKKTLLRWKDEKAFPIHFEDGVWMSDEELIRQWQKDRIYTQNKTMSSVLSL